MLQDLITILLIIASAGYLIFNVYRMIWPVKKRMHVGCAGCKGCEITGISHPRSYTSGRESGPVGVINRMWVKPDSVSAGWADRLQ